MFRAYELLYQYLKNGTLNPPPPQNQGLHEHVPGHAVLQPCNPAVGGPAKSQLVHEVDALGGEIGRLADRCYLQKRVLNRSKVLAQLTCMGWLLAHALWWWPRCSACLKHRRRDV